MPDIYFTSTTPLLFQLTRPSRGVTSQQNFRPSEKIHFNSHALYVDISRAREKAVVYTDNKEKLERQTKDFARKVTSKDFSKKIEAMRERGGITNNDRYKAPQDQGKTLESALAQIEKHTQAPAMVKTWEQNMEAKQMRMQERQRAAEAAKAAEQARRKKSSEITFSR